MALWLRILLAFLAAGLGGYASAIASTWATVYLYQLNNSSYQGGWGFELYLPLVVGGTTGAILAFTAVLNDTSSYIYVGATLSSFIFLIGVALAFTSTSPYDAIDWLCLPFILSVGLLTWGIRRRLGQRPTAS
jgi:hypothetical protein